MKFVSVIILLIAYFALSAALPQSDDDLWQNYKTKHNKKHNAKEEAGRKARFLARQRAIERHNSENKEWQMGHNIFSDMTDDELKSVLGGKPDITFLRSLELSEPLLYTDRALPASIDYRADPCMQPIQNQGSCGSCWSFAAVVPLEFNQCKQNNGTAVKLSEQMLVDCDVYDGGCNGGFYTNAWKYIKEKGGAMESAPYRYTGIKSTCKYNSTNVAAKVSTYGYTTPRPDATTSMTYLQNEGPLATAIKIVNSIYSYTGGVYSDPYCMPLSVDDADHAVVIVGYGINSVGIPYWIVRNSWGTSWGVGGYVAIKRGVNMCNIENWTAFVRVQ